MPGLVWVRFYTNLCLAVTQTFLVAKAAKNNRIFRIWSQRPLLASKPHGSHTHARQYDTLSHKWRLTEESPTGGSSRLPNIESYLRFYYKFSLIFNLYLIVKNTIVSLLDLEAFRDYRYLDCYIVGRFLFNGRVVDMANHFVCFTSLFNVIWYFIMQVIRQEFSLPCAEFLLHHPDTVAHWERRELRRQKELGGTSFVHHAPKSESTFTDHYSTLFHYARPPRCRAQIPSLSRGRILDWHIRLTTNAPHLLGQQAAQIVARLRPNRTARSWRELARVCLIGSIWGYIASTMVQAFFLRMCVALLFAKRGVELTHKNCIRWLIEQRRFNGSVNLWLNHKLIFDPPNLASYVEPTRFVSVLEPIGEDLVEFNYYQVIRIIVNLLENTIIYFEINMNFIGKFVLLALMAKDVRNYCDRLNERMARLVHRQRGLAAWRQVTTAAAMQGAQASCWPLGDFERVEMARRKEALECESTDLQAMIADLFYLIESYNGLVSVTLAYLVAFWLAYSALVSSWIFLPAADLPKGEWYVLHAFATTYLFGLVLPMTLMRRSCTRLYLLLASALATNLDHHRRSNHKRWLSLMQFFAPVPLHCFTLSRAFELSVGFILNLLLWLVSALLIASSFFRPRQ